MHEHCVHSPIFGNLGGVHLFSVICLFKIKSCFFEFGVINQIKFY